MTTASMAFDRHLNTDISEGLAALCRWRPRPGVAAPLGPRVVSGERYLATFALGRWGRRPIKLQVSRWSESRGTHVELVPIHRVRSTRTYLRRSRAFLRDALAAIEGGPTPMDRREPEGSELRRTA